MVKIVSKLAPDAYSAHSKDLKHNKILVSISRFFLVRFYFFAKSRLDAALRLERDSFEKISKFTPRTRKKRLIVTTKTPFSFTYFIAPPRRFSLFDMILRVYYLKKYGNLPLHLPPLNPAPRIAHKRLTGELGSTSLHWIQCRRYLPSNLGPTRRPRPHLWSPPPRRILSRPGLAGQCMHRCHGHRAIQTLGLYALSMKEQRVSVISSNCALMLGLVPCAYTPPWDAPNAMALLLSTWLRSRFTSGPAPTISTGAFRKSQI
jgi:hypothetical protein